MQSFLLTVEKNRWRLHNLHKDNILHTNTNLYIYLQTANKRANKETQTIPDSWRQGLLNLAVTLNIF